VNCAVWGVGSHLVTERKSGPDNIKTMGNFLCRKLLFWGVLSYAAAVTYSDRFGSKIMRLLLRWHVYTSIAENCLRFPRPRNFIRLSTALKRREYGQVS